MRFLRRRLIRATTLVLAAMVVTFTYDFRFPVAPVSLQPALESEQVCGGVKVVVAGGGKAMLPQHMQHMQHLLNNKILALKRVASMGKACNPAAGPAFAGSSALIACNLKSRFEEWFVDPGEDSFRCRDDMLKAVGWHSTDPPNDEDPILFVLDDPNSNCDANIDHQVVMNAYLWPYVATAVQMGQRHPGGFSIKYSHTRTCSGEGEERPTSYREDIVSLASSVPWDGDRRKYGRVFVPDASSKNALKCSRLAAHKPFYVQESTRVDWLNDVALFIGEQSLVQSRLSAAPPKTCDQAGGGCVLLLQRQGDREVRRRLARGRNALT